MNEFTFEKKLAAGFALIILTLLLVFFSFNKNNNNFIDRKNYWIVL